jgi:hypothetical protein
MDSQDKKAIDTWLPLFKGFYGTMWDGDSELDSFCEYNEVSSDDVEVDWLGYRQKVAVAITSEIESKLIELGLVDSVKFETIISPNYYNFVNDSIDVEVVPIVDNIAKYIHSNYDAFDTYLKERYTSRDGFISFRFNSALEWAEDTSNFTALGKDSHVLGAILDFALVNEEVSDYDYYEDVISNVYFDEFATINYTDIEELDSYDRIELIRNNIDSIDLEYGYLKVLSEEARKKSILLGTDFIEELVEVGYSELISALPFSKVNKDLEPK